MICITCGSDRVRTTAFGPTVRLRCRECGLDQRFATIEKAKEAWRTVWDAQPYRGNTERRKKVLYRHWEDTGQKAVRKAE